MFVFSRPEHLDDIAPPHAAAVAHCRTCGLDWLAAHDYQLVVPPLADYLETLTGGDDALNLQTFKITDTLSGCTLGIRADQTPQIARFDAGLTEKPAVRRYCYCGSTLRTKPPQPWRGRETLQLGAELFGAPPGGGDWEIASVALGALHAMGVGDVCLDLGHAGLFAELAADLPLTLRQQLTQDISRRDVTAVQQQAEASNLSPKTVAGLRILAGGGGREALTEARTVLSATALDVLEEVYARLTAEQHDCAISLSDLGSYGYHSGVVFSIYAHDRLLARGGRYQQRGGDEGTGFSIDLRAVYDLSAAPTLEEAVNVPLAPQDEQWWQALQALRAAKRPLRFVYEDIAPPPALCRQDGAWAVQEK